MNRIFKVVFNHSLGVWQAVAETARSRCKGTVKSIARLTLASACALSLPAPVAATDLLVGSGGNGGGTAGLSGGGSSTSGGGGGIGRNGGTGIGGGGGGGGIGGGGGGGTYATGTGGGAGGGVTGGGGNGNNTSGGSSGGAGGRSGGSGTGGGAGSNGGGNGGSGGAYVLGIAHGSSGGSGSGGGGGGGAGGNGIGGGGGGGGIGGGGGGGGADIIEIGAGGGGGGGAGIGGGGGGGGAGGAGAPGSNGGNGGSADAVISPGPTVSLSSNATHRFVGVGGGGGGGGGGQAGGNGLDGALTVNNATLTVSQSLLAGGGGGGGGSGSGGNGGSGTLVLTNGAGLSVANTLLIGGYSGGTGGSGSGGDGGGGTVNSAAGTTIGIGNNGRLVLGANAAGLLNLGAALNFGSNANFTINSTGTLNFGNATANAAGAGAITGLASINNNGAIHFNQSDASYTLAAELNGSGSVTHNSSGTTLFTGNNSYSGGTTINAGKLQIGNGGTSGSIAGNIVNNGTLTFNRSNALTYAGNVSGTGALTQSGTGTLTLTGSNSYTGGTTIQAGTLQIGDGGTSGSIVGNIVNNGSLTFNRSNALTYSGNVSGTGALTQSGAGTLTLTGSNSYTGGTTVSAGTLAVSTSSLLGTGTLNIGSTGTVSINAGAGNLALGTGNPGALVLNGNLNAAGISVGNGGTLGGSGSFAGNASIGAGGVYAPGNSIGTMTVANVSFASGSIYRVEANAAGQADRINATGMATLSGGTVDVQAASGSYQRDTRYTILNATGGVSGSFATVTSNLAFLTPSLAYDANNVFLNLTRNDIQFSSVATTPSEKAFATYLDSLGNNPLIMTLLTRIDGLSAQQAQAAFTSLGGNTLIAGTNMTMAGAAQFMQRVSARMHSPGGGTGLAFSGLRLAALDTVSDAPAVYAQAGMGASRGSAAYGRGFWMQAGGNRGNVNGNGGASGYEWRGGSLALGADTEIASGTVLGVAFGHDKTTASPDAGGSTKVKSPRLSFYGSHDIGPWAFSANAGYSRPDFDTQRLLVVGNTASVASSSHKGDEWSAGVEAQYTLDYGSFKVKPLAGLLYINLKQDGYVETGSIANLAVGQQRTESIASLFGARLQKGIHNDKGTFEVRAIWSHEFGETNPAMSGRLAAVPGGAAFTVTGVPLKRDALTLGLGFATQVNKRLSLHVDVNAEMRGSGQNGEMLMAGFRYAW